MLWLPCVCAPPPPSRACSLSRYRHSRTSPVCGTGTPPHTRACSLSRYWHSRTYWPPPSPHVPEACRGTGTRARTGTPLTHTCLQLVAVLALAHVLAPPPPHVPAACRGTGTRARTGTPPTPRACSLSRYWHSRTSPSWSSRRSLCAMSWHSVMASGVTKSTATLMQPRRLRTWRGGAGRGVRVNVWGGGERHNYNYFHTTFSCSLA